MKLLNMFYPWSIVVSVVGIKAQEANRLNKLIREAKRTGLELDRRARKTGGWWTKMTT